MWFSAITSVKAGASHTLRDDILSLPEDSLGHLTSRRLSSPLQQSWGRMWQPLITTVCFNAKKKKEEEEKEAMDKSMWNSKFWGNPAGGWMTVTDFPPCQNTWNGTPSLSFLSPLVLEAYPKGTSMPVVCVWVCVCLMAFNKTVWLLERAPFSHGVLMQER